MSESPTTQVLIERVQQGDPQALNDLLHRYQTRVLATVRIRLGQRLRQKVESWDIVQDVLMDALRKVQSFDFRSEGAFLKYLNRVVENRIRDEAEGWGAQKRDPAREISLAGQRSDQSGNPLELLADSAPTPSKIVSLAEDMARLEAAMDRLGEQAPEYHRLILAVKLEEQSYQEIAEEMGISVDAVRMKVRRAELALAKVYKVLESGS